MKYEKTYEFLEDFLKWNFGGLPAKRSEVLYGSPSFAYHMWLNLMKMKVEGIVSIVLFDSPDYSSHREEVERFMNRRRSNLTEIPAHFVTSIHDNGFDVHFDLKGDITERKTRIRAIYPLRGIRIDRFISKDQLPKSLHGNTVNALKTVMNRMEKFHDSWTNDYKTHWKEFETYLKILSMLGDESKSYKHTKPTLDRERLR